MTVSWQNEYNTDKVYFWLNDSEGNNVDFTNITVTDKQGNLVDGWRVSKEQDNHIVLVGDSVGKNRIYANITFSDDATDFSVDWTEAQYDAKKDSYKYKTGTNSYENQNWKYNKGNHGRPTPVPAAIWVMVSGLAALGGFRKFAKK